MFTHVQCCDIVPSLVSSFGESLDTSLYFAPQLPRGFDHFYGTGRGGEPPLPRGEGSPRGGAPIPGGYLRSATICFVVKMLANQKTGLCILEMSSSA